MAMEMSMVLQLVILGLVLLVLYKQHFADTPMQASQVPVQMQVQQPQVVPQVVPQMAPRVTNNEVTPLTFDDDQWEPYEMPLTKLSPDGELM